MSSRDRDTKSLQDKLKVFFKKGASAPLPAVNELVVSAELERELRSDAAPARRLRALRDLGDRVRVTRIQQGGAERLWVLTRDLLDDGCAESRHTALWFLRCIAEGQECAVMRTLLFRYLRESHAQHAAEDAPHRLSLLSTLTNAGKNIECFEEQVGEYLLEYMRSVGETGPALSEILALVINVVKYNATYLDEHVVHGIVDASCHLCAYSAEAGAVVSALALLEAVVAYSLLPRAALPAFVGALCRTVNLERHCQTSWKLMRSVLGADLGHAALQELAALPAAAAAASNADANNAAADAGAVRGAVFYINMALWGPRRVPSLRVSLLCVLPALLQAVSTNQPVVTYEVIQAIQSLVTRAPPDSLCAAWDVLLAVLAHAHRHDKSLDPPNELIHTRLHALLTSIEQLHEAGQYTGDTGQLLDLIDSSAQDRPEASVVRLITLRCATLSPARADWLGAALALGDKFVRRDTRLGVRMHALQQLLAVVKRHRFLYEEEVVVGLGVPVLGWCEGPLRAAAARAAAELAVLAAGDAATDLIDLLEKVPVRGGGGGGAGRAGAGLVRGAAARRRRARRRRAGRAGGWRRRHRPHRPAGEGTCTRRRWWWGWACRCWAGARGRCAPPPRAPPPSWPCWRPATPPPTSSTCWRRYLYEEEVVVGLGVPVLGWCEGPLRAAAARAAAELAVLAAGDAATDLIDLLEKEVVVGLGVPVLGWCEGPLRAAAARAAAELAVLAAGDAATDLIDLLEKIMNRPFESEEPSEADPEPDLTDVTLAVSGLLEVFHAKLLLAPAAHAARACLVLLDHLDHALNHPRYSAQHATCRKKILDMIFGLRANAFNSVGFCYDSAGNPVYGTAALRIKPMCSPSLLAEPLAARGHHPPPTNHPVPGTCILPVGRCARILTLALSREKEWSVLQHVLRALPALLQSRALCVGRRAQDLDLLASTLCAMLSDRSLAFPECLRGQKVLVSELHAAVLPSLGALAPYHAFLEPLTQQRVVRCLLRYGMVLRTPAPYLAALTQFTLEARDTMVKLLPEVLLDLSKVSDTKLIAGPMLEFLSTLTRLPRVFASFVEDQYMSVFAILLPYTNPSRYNHYVVSLAHHVVAAWFLKCRLSYRRNFVRFIIHGLHNYIIMPFEEQLHNYKVHAPANEDSSNRKRSSSLGSRGASAAPLGAGSRASAASASAAFHVELTETCVDLLARYTASACSVKPQRSDAAEWMFSGGQSMTWLVGHKLVTITTAGCNMNTIKQGMCDRCATLCRQHAESAASPLPPLALHDEHAKLVPPSDGSHGQNHNNLQVSNPPEIKRYSKHSLQHSRSTDNSASSSLSDRPDTVPSSYSKHSLQHSRSTDNSASSSLSDRPDTVSSSYSKHSLQHSRSTDNSASSSLSDRPDTVSSSYSKHSLQHSRSTDNSASSALSDRPDTVPSRPPSQVVWCGSYSKHSLQHSRSTDNSASSSLSDRPDTAPSSYSKHSLQHSRSTDNSASSSLSDRPDTAPSSVVWCGRYSKHSLQHSRSTDNSASSSLSDRPDTVPSRQNSAEYNPIVEALNNFTQRFEKISKEVDTEEAAWSRAGELAAGACPCWCADWAEIHVRSPSGDVAWLMRVQNQMGWENQESSLQDILALLAPAPAASAPPSSASSGIGDTSTNNASESESRSRSGSSASQAAHAQDLHKSSSDSVVAGERRPPLAATHCIGPPHQPQRMSTQPINIPGSPVRGAAHDDDMLLYVPEGKSRHPVRRSNSSPEMSSWKLPRDSPAAPEPPADPALLILLPGTEPTQSQSLHASKKANKKSDMRVSCEAIPEEMSGSSPLAAPAPPPHPHLMTYNSDPVSCEAIPEEMTGSSPLAAPAPPPHPHLMTYNSDPVSCEAIPEEMSGSSPLAAPAPPPHPHLMTYNSDPVSCEAIPEEMSGSSPLAAPAPPPHPHLMTYNSDPGDVWLVPPRRARTTPAPPPHDLQLRPRLVSNPHETCEAIPEEMSGSSPLAAPVTYNSDPGSGSAPEDGPTPQPIQKVASDSIVQGVAAAHAHKPPAAPRAAVPPSPAAAPATPSGSMKERDDLPPLSRSKRSNTISVMSPTRRHRDQSSTISTSSSGRSTAASNASSSGAGAGGGVTPSFVLLQLYHKMSTYPITPPVPGEVPSAQNPLAERPLLVSGVQHERTIKNLDRVPPIETYKVGVLYVGPGQQDNEVEVLKNEYGSVRYAEFLGQLGTLVSLAGSGAGLLEGAQQQPLFLNLEQGGKDGKYTYVWHDDVMQVLFHVATAMPVSAADPTCNEKRKYIGNDYVSIVYNDSGGDFPIQTIKGQFNLCIVVVEPCEHGLHRVHIKTKDERIRTKFLPHLEHCAHVVSDHCAATLARQLALHCALASHISQSLSMGGGSAPYASNSLERLRHIKRLRRRVEDERLAHARRAPKPYAPQGTSYTYTTTVREQLAIQYASNSLERLRHIKRLRRRVEDERLAHARRAPKPYAPQGTSYTYTTTVREQLAIQYASNSLERLRHIKRLRRRVEDERLAHARRAPKPYAPQGTSYTYTTTVREQLAIQYASNSLERLRHIKRLRRRVEDERLAHARRAPKPYAPQGTSYTYTTTVREQLAIQYASNSLERLRHIKRLRRRVEDERLAHARRAPKPYAPQGTSYTYTTTVREQLAIQYASNSLERLRHIKRLRRRVEDERLAHARRAPKPYAPQGTSYTYTTTVREQLAIQYASNSLERLRHIKRLRRRVEDERLAHARRAPKPYAPQGTSYTYTTTVREQLAIQYASNSLERLRHIKRLRRRVEDERLAHARRAPKPYAPQGDTARRVAMDDFNDYT
ncbi:tuberin [Cydia fagiglandana]|uniref:tuberin n=1 Tax=Cydia fagiglandana TaxID=1458189 RepID=UPI002FEE4AEE